ncbi:hypothetical protein VNO78_21437 [Psophocarpus tetragonolobus]|uniref:DYW domain-containing protein n=1 Tax=Psophocarpus tetragonolobus TaxID=3891 RepID=A0AAN9SBR9_PSOTE
MIALINTSITTPILRYGRYQFDCYISSLQNSHAVAQQLFDETPLKQHNQMLFHYSRNGQTPEALNLFLSLYRSGLSPTKYTMSCVLNVCARCFDGRVGEHVHCQCVKSGLVHHVCVGTCLLDMYMKTGNVRNGRRVFDEMGHKDVVSWTAVISGYLLNGGTVEALKVFSQMKREGVKPNGFTYSAILAVTHGVFISEILAEVIKTNNDKLSNVGAALLRGFITMGNIHDAGKVFEQIEPKNIVAWTAMLVGYAQAGETDEAAKIFHQLTKEGIKPNEYTFSSMIKACTAPAASAELGKQFHACAIKMRFNNHLSVSNSLVTMYAKRGDIDSAHEVFKRQKERSLVSWSSMISGYAQHGQAKKALEVFEEMLNRNMEMDAIAFTGVLSACTHAGLVNKGEYYFNVMINDHHINPTMEHYSCMIDLYRRAGMLEKAMDIVKNMPFHPNAGVWRILLAASRVHHDMKLGKLAAENIISLEPQDAAGYVELYNMYAAAGNWHDAVNVKKLMHERKVKKETGYSWIEVKNKTYAFKSGDSYHPLSKHIYSKLSELNIRLKEAGYQPDTNSVVHDIDDNEQKETILSHHSERLAIAFGLIATLPDFPIHIVKNLRVCGDCHNFIKLVSLVEQRYIVVRDRKRFHHFKGGLCSCGDYW